MTTTRRRLRSALYCAALTISVLVSFENGLDGTFIWDDLPLIVNNRYIKDSSHVWRSFSHSFWDVASLDENGRELQVNAYYRPLVTLTYIADFKLHQLRAAGYHLTNLALHVLATWLVFFVALRVFCAREGSASGSPATDANVDARANAGEAPVSADELAFGMAFLSALFFAIHPSKAEAVVWISGRTDVLMTVCWLSALLLFWSGLDRTRPSVARLALGAGSMMLAALSKESAVCLAAVLPVIDWLLISRGDRRRFRRHALWCHLPLFVASAAHLAWRLLHQPASATPRVWLPVHLHLLRVCETFGHYVRILVDPFHPSTQIGAFSDPRHPNASMVLFGAVGLLAGALLLYRGIRGRSATVVIGLTLCFAALLPVLNLVPLSLQSLAAERFLYLPLAGIGLVLGDGVLEVLARLRRWRWPARGGAALLVLVLASSYVAADRARAAEFSDPLRFWSGEAERNPDNPAVEVSLAHAFVGARRYAQAEQHFARALTAWTRLRHQRQSEVVDALLALVDVRLLRVAELDQTGLEQVSAFLRALSETALAAPATQNRSRTLTLHIGTLAVEVEVRDPRIVRALHSRQAIVFAMRGMLASRLGDDAAALSLLERAFARSPARLEFALNLSLAALRAERLDLAREALGRASRIEPDFAAVAEMGRVAAAAAPRIARLEALRPERTARRSLMQAELYVVTKAPLRAVRALRQAIALAPRERTAYALLASELAAAGDLDQALATVDTARAEFGAEPGLGQLEARVREIHRARESSAPGATPRAE